jgi:hypothetical protein
MGAFVHKTHPRFVVRAAGAEMGEIPWNYWSPFARVQLHVDIIRLINMVNKCIVAVKQRAEARVGETRLTTATEVAWLAAG